MTGKHLSDCFIDVMAYLSYLLKTVETGQPLFEEVHNDIKRLLTESEACLSRGEFPREDYDQARFAICAWVDEAILGSGWPQKNYWLNCQLQRVYYHTADAGEQFFERLKSLGLQQQEVREVYYLCLALGFTGRYCHPGDEYQLEQIKTSQLKLLLGSSAGLPALEREELFPEAHPSGDPQAGARSARAGSRLVSASCLAAPVLLFSILYLIYHFTLSGISENFLRTVIR